MNEECDTTDLEDLYTDDDVQAPPEVAALFAGPDVPVALPPETKPRIDLVEDRFDEWDTSVENREAPVLYAMAPPGHPLTAVEVGPNLVTMIGLHPR